MVMMYMNGVGKLSDLGEQRLVMYIGAATARQGVWWRICDHLLLQAESALHISVHTRIDLLKRSGSTGLTPGFPGISHVHAAYLQARTVSPRMRQATVDRT